MFEKELQILNNKGITWVKSYIGYDIEYVFNKINPNSNKLIILDMTTDFYTNDHFYKFTLVKVFKRFINSKKTITTTGQLLFFLKSINFDIEIINEIEDVIKSDSSKTVKCLNAWNTIFKLLNKIGIKCIIFKNSEFFFEGRKNNKKEIDKILKNIINKSKEYNINVIFENKEGFNDLEPYQTKKDFQVKIDFDNLMDSEAENDNLFYDLYYGELIMYLKKQSYEDNREKLKHLYNLRISTARGGNQLRYVIFLLALSGKIGMTITALSEVLEISAGATGSVLKRLQQSGLIRKIKNNYIVKNTAFQKYILEINK